MAVAVVGMGVIDMEEEVAEAVEDAVVEDAVVEDVVVEDMEVEAVEMTKALQGPHRRMVSRMAPRSI